ncbi:MAG: flavin reductase family protein [Rhodospirillaceae bacterium]|jgi:flavin reductase (DIM6/NTAB) family NADH-FMN oxidoreductase RutF|nr:flavin reductase family protein [Rhodospirillaceae bacterium]MBT6139510.1 flavin reductase family protein [Rhodospirillaceae bacterium]
MFFKPGTHKDHGFRHDPFKAVISPRPIGWISTLDEHGTPNLAPYSFFNAVCADPPVVMFGSGGRTDGTKKDSQLNAEASGEFVCSIVSHAQRDHMNKTSVHLPHGENEMPPAGLEGLASKMVKPLRVKGAPVHLECKYLQSVQMPCWHESRENWVIFGEVIGIHIDESCVVDGMVDVLKYTPVARLGYMDYSEVTELFAMDRPD